jgi:WD40 repeat protein
MVRGLRKNTYENDFTQYFVETFRRNVFTSGFTHQFSNAEFETRVGGFCLYSREFHSPGVFKSNFGNTYYRKNLPTIPSMTYCLAPNCQKPQNPDATKFCLSCGSQLLLKNQYQAIKPIGEGGFSRTFLAMDANRCKASGQEICTLYGHSSWVWCIAFSPDGATLASASGDKSIKLWNLATGQEIRTLHGHSSLVYSVAFSPDGTTLASGSADNTINIWRCD